MSDAEQQILEASIASAAPDGQEYVPDQGVVAIAGRDAVKLRVTDCMTHFQVPQPTDWQRIGNQIDAAFVFTRTNFVKMIDPIHLIVPAA